MICLFVFFVKQNYIPMEEEIIYKPSQLNDFLEVNEVNQTLKKQVDSVLMHDMQLLRLDRQKAASHLQIRKQNDLILEYTKQIYKEYNIANPLIETNLSCLTSNPSKKTIKKQKLYLMSSQTLKYSLSSRNLVFEDQQDPINFSDDSYDVHRNQPFRNFYKNDKTAYVSQGHLDHESTVIRVNQKSLTNLTYQPQNEAKLRYQSNRQLISRIDLKIEEETKVSFVDENASQPQIFPLLLQEVGKCQQKSFYSLDKMHSSFSNPQEIDSTYRYCIGCENPILNANIKAHQRDCREFTLMIHMSPEKIVKSLKEKVNRMRQAVFKESNSLVHEDVSNFQATTLKLVEEGSSILSTGAITPKFQSQYIKAIDLSKKWCLLSEQASKINWFLKTISRLSAYT